MKKGHYIIIINQNSKVLKQYAEDIDWKVTVHCFGGLGNILFTVKVVKT